jgi:phosphatidate cytidylyltransferase
LGISSIQIFNHLDKFGTSKDMFYGYVYITIFFRFIFYTAQLDNNYVVWLIFIIAWSTDTFAYFTGLLFGKHKLAPIISPKKTIEGAIGGIVGCAVSTFIFSIIFIPEIAVISILFGILGSVISQLGDLNASMIKRSNGIKDFGYIIPGHGGILDRFDSILFTAPYVYAAYSILDFMGVIK